ncbi:MAG: hypothetical protein HC838_04130 [Spirulinaceae cyanobacterium RM2_2_10]|nr:hypothetical protein [Spirulinaceae cyanobacterium RM2_2_10]
MSDEFLQYGDPGDCEWVCNCRRLVLAADHHRRHARSRPENHVRAPDETIERYLSRLFAARDQQPQPLSEADLAAIARDLGLTETDLATAQRVARDHRTRAQGYLQHRRWDDALAELEPAAALQPFETETIYLQAKAHAGRWRAHRQAVDRDRARALAKHCLAQQPDYAAAFQLLNDLDQLPVGRLARAPRGALVAGAICVGVGVPLTAAIASLLLWQRGVPDACARPCECAARD